MASEVQEPADEEVATGEQMAAKEIEPAGEGVATEEQMATKEKSPQVGLAGVAALPNYGDDVTFSSTGERLPLPSEIPVSPRARLIALMVAVSALLGIISGIDFIMPESGSYNHREMIQRFAMTAPNGTAALNGHLILPDGSDAANFTVEVYYLGEPLPVKSTMTDESGEFEFQKLDPGLIEIFSNNSTHGFSTVALLSPPALMEPVGFTSISFQVPDEERFDSEGVEGVSIIWIYHGVEELNDPLYDGSAAQLYVAVGYGFVGLGLIGIVISFIGWRSGEVGTLRLGGVVAFFGMGHFGGACCLGLVALLATIGLGGPKHLDG